MTIGLSSSRSATPGSNSEGYRAHQSLCCLLYMLRGLANVPSTFMLSFTALGVSEMSRNAIRLSTGMARAVATNARIKKMKDLILRIQVDHTLCRRDSQEIV